MCLHRLKRAVAFLWHIFAHTHTTSNILRHPVSPIFVHLHSPEDSHSEIHMVPQFSCSFAFSPSTTSENSLLSWLCNLILKCSFHLLSASSGFLFSHSNSGKEAIHLTVPDTITKWKAMTFCTSQTSGFGLSPIVGLTAFKPFFVDLTLPYSVVHGESFRLTATIFNYLKDCITVRMGGTGNRCQPGNHSPHCNFSLNWKHTSFPWERYAMLVSLLPCFPKPLCSVSFTCTLYLLNILFRFRQTWLNQRNTRWNHGQILLPPAVSVLMKQKPITGISQLSSWVRERWELHPFLHCICLLCSLFVFLPPPHFPSLFSPPTYVSVINKKANTLW